MLTLRCSKAAIFNAKRRDCVMLSRPGCRDLNLIDSEDSELHTLSTIQQSNCGKHIHVHLAKKAAFDLPI